MNSRVLNKAFKLVAYPVLTVISILIGYILVANILNKESDKIVLASDKTGSFTNINPKFVIDFIDGQYVRFESISSTNNPFEDRKESIWDKIIYSLGIKKDKKGIEISLLEVTYDDTLLSMLDSRGIERGQGKELNKKFELSTLGREIGGKEDGVSKDTVISKNIYKGVDIEYQVIKGKGLKEEIVLNELPEYIQECDNGVCSMPVNRFVFNIKLDEGLILKRSIDSNSAYPSGTYYITDSKGNYYAHFLPEFAVDSLGYKTSSVISNISLTDSGEYLYEIILDPEWLLSKDRVFPIRIDPSLIHDSEMEFDMGIYDKTGYNPNLTIGINSNTQMSGTYTSSILKLEENTTLKNIQWQGYGESTGSGELPFSELGLIYIQNFNDLISDKVKWGEGSLYLNTGSKKILNINSNQSENISLELWSYRRNLLNEQSIFTSELGSLWIKDSKYLFKDLDGNEYITQIPVRYNEWQFISFVFNISGTQLSIYIDEYEYQIDSIPFKRNTLDTITFSGYGYIDTVRVYERLLARNEIISNSQYGNIYLQLSKSTDGVNWVEWEMSKQYLPIVSQGDGYIDISLEEEGINKYELISFEFLSQDEGELIYGDSKFGNSINEGNLIYLNDLQGSIETSESIKYIDLDFTPLHRESGCLLSLGELEIYVSEIGTAIILFNGQQFESEDMYELGIPNHMAISFGVDGTKMFLNGNSYTSNTAISLQPGLYSISEGCKSVQGTFQGGIENVRVSTEFKSDIEILKYINRDNRSYALKPVFRASLQNDQQILDINDISFSISEMDFGALNHIVNLNVGDSIVIKEEEFSVEGIVSYLEEDTGLVEVEKWLDGGSIPQSGFTNAAQVLKWQREYIPVKGIEDINMVQSYLNMAYTKDIYIRKILLSSDIDLTNSPYLLNSGSTFVRYRLIFTTLKYGLSPYISSITIDYEQGGPGMEQIMRHGQWFNDEGKQGFWWVK